ncbi:hypothetical protein LCGC14_1952330 [marine sediment metagenome]|uniref:Uncharacterized protein n=1 Tax=marine sediment metagenome TaxID=412755 RepID=A0A0F9FHB3_9ZZZZ
MTDAICNQDFKNCPYRLIDMENPRPLCDYYRLHARLILNREFSEIPVLVRRACKWMQNEESRLKFIREIARKKTLDFLENTQVGDTVFCGIAPFHAVKLLEKPIDDSKFVLCEAPSGKVIKIQACHLSRISKGSYFSDYFIEGVENEKKAQELEYKARYYGFGSGIEKKDDGYLLRIYGDSQQEVDDFIVLYLEQDFDISPYI